MLENSIQESTSCLPYNNAGLLDLTEIATGFSPAFRNLINDETHLSTTDEGVIAPEHRIDNLPIEWVSEWAPNGYAKSLIPTVVAGYIRADRFFTLAEIMKMPLDS